MQNSGSVLNADGEGLDIISISPECIVEMEKGKYTMSNA